MLRDDVRTSALDVNRWNSQEEEVENVVQRYWTEVKEVQYSAPRLHIDKCALGAIVKLQRRYELTLLQECLASVHSERQILDAPLPGLYIRTEPAML